MKTKNIVKGFGDRLSVKNVGKRAVGGDNNFCKNKNGHTAMEKILRQMPLTIGLIVIVLMFVSSASAAPVASIDVSATSPHVANGTDYSNVTVTVKDVDGNPVVGADIIVIRLMGYDYKEAFNVTDNGGGTYTAFVNSTTAGNATIIAEDTISGISNTTTVIFEPGPITDIILTATYPRDFEPSDMSVATAIAIDASGNVVSYPTANITITTDLGTTSPTVCENGTFIASITSNDLGIANITATDNNTGVNKTIQIVFPAIYIGSEEDAIIVGSTFTMPVHIFVSNTSESLGYYDLNISFNSSIIHFLNTTDGNTTDEFAAPNFVLTDNNTIRIYQNNTVSNVSPTGNVYVANLIFESVGIGDPSITIPEAVLIKGSNPKKLPVDPKKAKNPPQKKKKIVCLKIFVEKGSGVAREEIKEDIKDTQKIYDDAFRVCCALKFTWDGIINEFDTVDYDIDPPGPQGKDGKLEDWKKHPMENNGVDVYTSEEKRLIARTKRDNKCANIYYFKENLKTALGEGSSPDWKNVGANNALIVLGKGARTYASNKGLAHEMGHFLGVDKQKTIKSDQTANKNLMHYDGGTELVKDQCTAIMNSAFTKLLKDQNPDFGDAPDPKYPSKKASDGARHIQWEYEWLGNTSFPSVDGEKDSKQVDKDKLDDGVTFYPPYKKGVQNKVDVVISTSGEKKRYIVTTFECVTEGVTAGNGVIDVNIDGKGPVFFFTKGLSAVEVAKKIRLFIEKDKARIPDLISVTRQGNRLIIVIKGDNEEKSPIVERVDDTGITITCSKVSETKKKLYLNAWFDWNGNGKWEAGELTISQAYTPSTWGGAINKKVIINFIPPADQPEKMWARFRLDYGQNVNKPTGPANFGEVEDHYVSELPEMITKTKYQNSITQSVDVSEIPKKFTAVDGEWTAKWTTVLLYVQKGTKYSIEIFLNKTGYVTRVDFERWGIPITEIPYELAEQSLAKLPPGFAVDP